MRAALGATGVVLLHASGIDAGQSVPHLHLHLVPCWADESVTFWPAVRSAHTVTVDPRTLLGELSLTNRPAPLRGRLGPGDQPLVDMTG